MYFFYRRTKSVQIGKSGNMVKVKEKIKMDDSEKINNEKEGSTESDQFLEQFVAPKSFQNEDDIELEPKDDDEDSKSNDDDSSKELSEKSTDEIYEEVEDQTSQNGKWKTFLGIFQKTHDNEQESANDDGESKLNAEHSSKATSEKSTDGDSRLNADDSSKATSEKSTDGDSKLIKDDSSKAKSEKSLKEIYEEEGQTSENGKWRSLFGMILPKNRDNEQEPEKDDGDSKSNTPSSFKAPSENPTDKIPEEIEDFEMIKRKEVGLKPVERRNININIVNTRYETTMASENENNWMVLTSTSAVIALCLLFVIIGMVLYSNQMLFYI